MKKIHWKYQRLNRWVGRAHFTQQNNMYPGQIKGDKTWDRGKNAFKISTFCEGRSGWKWNLYFSISVILRDSVYFKVRQSRGDGWICQCFVLAVCCIFHIFWSCSGKHSVNLTHIFLVNICKVFCDNLTTCLFYVQSSGKKLQFWSSPLAKTYILPLSYQYTECLLKMSLASISKMIIKRK